MAAITQPEQPGDPAAWRTYIRVERADDAAERVRAAGGAILAEPFDAGDAGRMAVFADCEGAVFRVWEPKQHKGAGVVNEHGSVNFNTLHTRDLESAKAFYRAVFGWDTLELGPGMAMWTLPGYGDHLEASTPGLREQMAAVGAPPRFEDVVASVVPCEEDEAPRWSVTFAVDDADAIARRAAELGGQVTVAPFDAPWVRTTVITDPQGASFMASKFVPENKDLRRIGRRLPGRLARGEPVDRPAGAPPLGLPRPPRSGARPGRSGGGRRRAPAARAGSSAG